MSVAMPSKVELPMPPGDPEALADLVQDTAGAAYWLTVLGNRLAGPAAAAPGWIGADAAAAAAQIGRVAVLTRDASNSVLEATGRLRAHVECLREARRAVEQLREEQDEDFRVAARRLWQMDNPSLAVMTGSAEWVSVVDEVKAAEAARRRRHAALMEDVEDDAAATARVLAEACAVIGGTGGRGDAARVVAFLAEELPGWGDLEMARRGRQLAPDLLEGDPEETEAAAQEALAYAGSPVFADALLAALGVDGVKGLLATIGLNVFEGRDTVPRLLAAALGSASGIGPAAAVLDAAYGPLDDLEFNPDTVVAGMTAVLGASRSVPSGGLPTSMVGSWARQLLLYQPDRYGPIGAVPWEWAPDLQDPAALALSILAERADPAVSAQLLGDARVWESALARMWPDDGAAFASVVAHAGQEPGVLGARAVRNGLVVIGAGLVTGEAPEHPVTQRTVAAVSFALGSGVAEHVPVVARSLAGAADGQLPDYSRDLLRGLGIAARSNEAAAMIEESLNSWIDAQPPADQGDIPLAVAVPSAYGAALNYGYRLPWVLEEEAQRDQAERTRWMWDNTVDFALMYLKKPVVGVLAQALADRLAGLVGADGGWDAARDPGVVVRPIDAINAAVVALAPYGPVDQVQVNTQANDSFVGATSVIGYPVAPVPPEDD